MQRSPIACHRAAQSLTPAPANHLWISDDLLSRTLLRFFRVNCPHQKRHGSHVPGPLEAMRRAAKRRMTAQANSYLQPGPPPPLFNLAALFGSRKPEETWRYEPPSMRQSSSDSSFDIPSSHLDPPPQLPTPVLEQSRSIEVEDDLKDFQHHTGTADATPVHALNNHIIDSREAPPIDTFDKSAVRVLRHLPDTDSPRHVAIRLLSKPGAHLPNVYSTRGLELLQLLESLSANSDDATDAGCVYVKYASVSVNALASNCSEHDTSLRLLIGGLWRTVGYGVETAPLLRHLSMKLSDDYIRRCLLSIFERPNNAVNEIAELFNTSHDLASTAAHLFDCIPHTVLCTWASELQGAALLSRENHCFWLRLSYYLDCKSGLASEDSSYVDVVWERLVPSLLQAQGSPTPRRLLVEALLYKLTRDRSFAGVDPAQSYEFAATYLSDLMQQEKDKLPLYAMVTGLLSRLDKASLPNHGVLELLIPTVKAENGDHGALVLLLYVMESAVERAVRLSSTEFLTSHLKQLVCDLDAAFSESIRKKKDRYRQAFAIRALWQLQAAVTLVGEQTWVLDSITSLEARRKFTHIIDRANECRVVPMAYRQFYSDIPMALRGPFIYQTAHQYSVDWTRTYRQNWRSMYYLYKFLLGCQLPFTPLFVQAVVRVSLVQPLTLRAFVSARRLRWVMKLVEQVEGVEAAKKIEMVFWEWRGDLIMQARDKMISTKTFGRAHMRTLKSLGMM